MSDHRIPDLSEMTPRAQAIALAYYEAGACDGWVRGWDAAHADEAARWAAMARDIRARANVPEYAVLAERRGQPERAARQRQILAERGVA